MPQDELYRAYRAAETDLQRAIASRVAWSDYQPLVKVANETWGAWNRPSQAERDERRREARAKAMAVVAGLSKADQLALRPFLMFLSAPT